MNQVMQQAVRDGDAHDVGRCPEALGVYTLDEAAIRALEVDHSAAPNGMDFCDLGRGVWIWSIGRHRETGEVYAATDGRFYEHPDYVCEWLR